MGASEELECERPDELGTITPDEARADMKEDERTLADVPEEPGRGWVIES